ncbi:MAG: hypothetical protein WBK77_05110 [Alphaproteobacteria bacterium]
MPHGPLHKTKLKKNIAVAAAIFGFIALFWVITMIRIAQNAS